MKFDLFQELECKFNEDELLIVDSQFDSTSYDLDVELGFRLQKNVVTLVLPMSKAYLAGVKPGAKLMKVNGCDAPESIEDTRALFQGAIHHNNGVLALTFKTVR